MNYFFQAGGSLPANAPSYIFRKADKDLSKAIKAGKFAYIFNARQTGKSSIRVRTTALLQNENYTCFSIDATSVGNHKSSVSDWFYELAYQLARKAGILNTFKTWNRNTNYSSKKYFLFFLRQVLIHSLSTQIVLFIDEIDAILRIQNEKFNKNEVFTVFKEIYVLRKSEHVLKKFHIVLLGVTFIKELIDNSRNSIFSKGTDIQLKPFKPGEAEILANGLSKYKRQAAQIIKEILFWTGGQPYLTQRLCKLITDENYNITSVKKDIAALVERAFFTNPGLRDDDNLVNIENRLLKKIDHTQSFFTTYNKLLTNQKIKYNHSIVHQQLLISGLIIIKAGQLQIANRMYLERFAGMNLPG